jgi:hypothetical protein
MGYLALAVLLGLLGTEALEALRNGGKKRTT